MVNLSLEHGHTDASCYAYVWWHDRRAAIWQLQGRLPLGRLGYDLVERRGLEGSGPGRILCFGVSSCRGPNIWRTGHDLIRRAFDAANTIGDSHGRLIPATTWSGTFSGRVIRSPRCNARPNTVWGLREELASVS